MSSFTSSLVGTSSWCDHLSRQPHPLLTWYGEGRIELSGPVLARWLAKADNFLAQEFPFGAGSACVALPPSWQRLVWDAALLMRGWLAADPTDAELVISDDAALLTDAATRGQIAVAQTLAPLALSWPGQLPTGVLDGTGELMGQADYVLEPAPGTPLLIEAAEAAGVKAGDRALLKFTDPERLLGWALTLWEARAAALVIDEAGDKTGSKTDDKTDDKANDTIRRIMAQERVTLVIE